MNTGKSAIRNAKISFDIDGLETGGVLFIGMIKAGESKTGSANFQVSSSKLGDVKGTATLSYEDDFGKSYSESISLSSTIIKKKAVKSDSDMDKKKSKFSLWWLFLLIGLAIGGGVGAIIPISINQSRRFKIINITKKGTARFYSHCSFFFVRISLGIQFIHNTSLIYHYFDEK